MLIQRETGGNLAEIIDNLSYVIRERFRVQGQLKIFTAQGRMTGIALVFLPIAIAFFIHVTNPEYLKPLLNDRIGRTLAVLAVVLQIVGAITIKKIIRIKI
jgi:tight adherence protein B